MDAQRSDARYVISVAAELAGVHPQTLRTYERKGLVSPRRSAGNVRLYSDRDVHRLREIQRLTQEERLNLAGVRMVLELSDALERAEQHVRRLTGELEAMAVRIRDEVAAAHASHRFELVPFRHGAMELHARRRPAGPVERGR